MNYLGTIAYRAAVGGWKMNPKTIVIIWLTVQLTFVSYKWLQAEKQLSFVQGQMAVCNAAVDMAVETGSNPYVKAFK